LIDTVSILAHDAFLRMKDAEARNESPTPSKYYEARREKIGEQVYEAREYYDSLIRSVPFLLSQDALDTLDRLDADLKKVADRWQETPSDEFYYEVNLFHRKCLRDLSLCAKKDLGVRSWWWA